MSDTCRCVGLRVEIDEINEKIWNKYVIENPDLPWGSAEEWDDKEKYYHFDKRENLGKLIMQCTDTGIEYLVLLDDFEHNCYDVFSVVNEDKLINFKEMVKQIFGGGSLEGNLRDIEFFTILYHNSCEMPF